MNSIINKEKPLFIFFHKGQARGKFYSLVRIVDAKSSYIFGKKGGWRKIFMFTKGGELKKIYNSCQHLAPFHFYPLMPYVNIVYNDQCLYNQFCVLPKFDLFFSMGNLSHTRHSG